MPPREDPADVWIGAGSSLDDVPEGARVGTASLRRRAQLLAARPDLRVRGAARQRRHPPAQAGRGRARRDRARRRRPAPARPRERDRLRDPGRDDGPGRRPGHAGAAGARRRRGGERGGRRRLRPRRRPRADRRARRGAPARGRAAPPRSASSPGSTAPSSRSTPSSASPTAASGCATGSRATPPSRRGRRPAAERLLGAGARDLLDRAGGDGVSARAGVVYLVGAGPGDPGLMTARSLDLIAAADAIFYDRLIPPGALDGAREDAELVYVGKQPGVPSVPQEEIGARLVEAARAGKSVVRLKGGDPFVFGRGGEEGEALRAAGVEFEVVPGVTAGVAATAYAGIPVTHRDDASAVAFVTGHEDPEKAEIGARLGRARPLPRHPRLLHGRQTAGRERGGADRRRARPGGAGGGDRTRHLAGPAHRRRHPGHDRRGGRARGDQGAGADRRRRGRRPPRGPRLVRAPPPARPPRRRHPRPRPGQRPRRHPARARRRGGRAAGDPDRAADRDGGGPGGRGRDRRLRAGLPDQPQRRPPALRGDRRGGPRRAGAGRRDRGRDRPGTARALAERGVLADVVPERFVAEALVEALADVDVEGARVLVARAAEARDVLPDALRERGAEVDVVALYETVRESPDEDRSPPPRAPTTSPSPPPRP